MNERVAQAAHELEGIHRTRERLDHTFTSTGRPAHSARTGAVHQFEWTLAQFLELVQLLRPATIVRFGDRHVDESVKAEIHVEHAGLLGSLQFVDHITRRPSESDRLVTADEGAKVIKASKPGVHMAAVAARRPRAAEVRFHDDDVSARVELKDPPGRPQTGEAAADDHDLSVDVALQRNKALVSAHAVRLDPVGLFVRLSSDRRSQAVGV